MYEYVKLIESQQMRMPESEARWWTWQLASAVNHLHACGVVHRDIKLENIMISHCNQLKLGDFGLSEIRPAGTLVTTASGSKHYVAPEVWCVTKLGGCDGRAADVWSIGICIFTMLTGNFPFNLKGDPDNHPTKLRLAYERTRGTAFVLPSPPRVLKHETHRELFSPLALQVLDACLSLLPWDRPLAANLVLWPWFRLSLDETP